MLQSKTIILVGAALVLYSTGAAAQLTNQGMLDQVVNQFATKAASWQTVVMNAANWLFWTLGTISLVWTGGMMVLRKADIGEFFAEFVRFILFFGFFLWLLRNGPTFASSIIQSLQQLGEQASGTSSVTPSGIVDIGFLIWKQAITNLSIWSPVDSFVGTLMSAAIMLLLAAVAVNMLLILVSAWILMYAGIFFLGFGGSRWTSDMAINYYKTVLGVAVQLFAMVLLVGIGNDLLTGFYSQMNTGTLNFQELGVMLVFCFALLMLVNKVPGLLSGVITGAGVGHAGIGNFGAGAIAGAAMGAAGMATTAAGMAGAAMMGGAQSIAGGAQAIMAAFSKANASDSGGGSPGMGDLMGAAGGAGGGSGGESGGGSALASAMGDSGGGTSQAMGGSSSGGAPGEVKSGGSRAAAVAAKVGRVAAGTAANLAQGSWDVAKAKAGSIKDGAMDRIGETTGGKIAAAIKARDNQPAFGGDSLSGASDEVSAFVNKSPQGGTEEQGHQASVTPSADSSDSSTRSVFD
ncbi:MULTISPECIES: P-type conjugative transfer protein TrbL [Chromobacterium]|uniref:P-type conjugative transfer protein TrbL n=1 Tax=Chromobacterium TaxID=535 RepID=UPI0018894B08|nr:MULTISPECIES: P-type conjugative transfer protein TrbL [Chromobacterium]QOZ85221.1 P-type conjugative transfer protein TrbL [Chromobacterium sp. Rain0013]WON85430.1 P-type conjugative transfer protein TrbL [Chromobacterium haemolyticum]